VSEKCRCPEYHDPRKYNTHDNKGKQNKKIVPSSLTANAHNEIYAFYMEKSGFVKKKYEPIEGGGGCPPPFESTTEAN